MAGGERAQRTLLWTQYMAPLRRELHQHLLLKPGQHRITDESILKKLLIARLGARLAAGK